jgi:hypothetical protein
MNFPKYVSVRRVGNEHFGPFGLNCRCCRHDSKRNEKARLARRERRVARQAVRLVGND